MFGVFNRHTILLCLFDFLGCAVKRITGEKNQTIGTHPNGSLFKERRRSYYHGKYRKKTIFLLLLASSATLIILS